MQWIVGGVSRGKRCRGRACPRRRDPATGSSVTRQRLDIKPVPSEIPALTPPVGRVSLQSPHQSYVWLEVYPWVASVYSPNTFLKVSEISPSVAYASAALMICGIRFSPERAARPTPSSPASTFARLRSDRTLFNLSI